MSEQMETLKHAGSLLGVPKERGWPACTHFLAKQNPKHVDHLRLVICITWKMVGQASSRECPIQHDPVGSLQEVESDLLPGNLWR